MKSTLEVISLILRLSLGVAFLIAGSQSLVFAGDASQLGMLGYIANISSMFNVDPSDFLHYAGMIQIIFGLLLILGLFVAAVAVMIILWNIVLLILNPLLLINPLYVFFQGNQLVGQFAIALTIFHIGAPILSLDHFFFPFKYELNKKLLAKVTAILSVGLGVSLALGFASIFLFIDGRNYVVFNQWYTIEANVPFMNMAFIGAMTGIGAVLLLLGFARRQMAFLVSIVYLIAIAAYAANQFETIAMFGLALGLAMIDMNSIQSKKLIPKRKLTEYT